MCNRFPDSKPPSRLSDPCDGDCRRGAGVESPDILDPANTIRDEHGRDRIYVGQGTANVLAQPRDAFELPARNDLGIRIGKDFTMGPRVLRLSLDVQNLFNSDTPLSIDNNGSHTATYLEPTAIFLPRRAILGVRYNF